MQTCFSRLDLRRKRKSVRGFSPRDTSPPILGALLLRLQLVLAVVAVVVVLELVPSGAVPCCIINQTETAEKKPKFREKERFEFFLLEKIHP